MQTKIRNIAWCYRKLLYTFSARRSSHVPKFTTWQVDQNKTNNVVEPSTKIDNELIEHLERLSLVDFSNEEGIQRLEAAIAFADQLKEVNTEGVECMDSVLEEQSLYLDTDEVKEGNCRKQVLQNAVKSYEDYFIAPTGNIVLKKERDYDRD